MDPLDWIGRKRKSKKIFESQTCTHNHTFSIDFEGFSEYIDGQNSENFTQTERIGQSKQKKKQLIKQSHKNTYKPPSSLCTDK